jgi:TRAP-type C4-dicarboxylate transport system substrate-binding protein
MKKSIISLIAILILASLLISACASQPAVTTTTQPQTTAPSTTSAAPKTTAPAATTAPATTAASSQAVELRFSHHNPPQAWTTVQFLNPWAKKVEEATKGAVKITMFPAQSIASMQDNYDAVINNLAQMTWITVNAYPGRFPLSDVISLPFLSLPSGTLNGKKVPASVVNSHIIQELYETVPNIQKEWSQTKLLFLHTSSPYLLVTKKPIKTIADVKGLKIAVLGTGPNLEMWKKVGASPVYIGAPAVYESA